MDLMGDNRFQVASLVNVSSDLRVRGGPSGAYMIQDEGRKDCSVSGVGLKIRYVCIEPPV